MSSFSLYLHIPFCSHLCTYCAFNTYASMESLIPRFVDALCKEMLSVAASAPDVLAHSLYFGGGTPSLLSHSQVAQLIRAARTGFHLAPDAEITLEVNPESIDSEKLAGYRTAGVNRLSIGVQSSQDQELQMFGRRHRFEDAYEAFRAARGAGFGDISLDLIYGAPGQGLDSWRETLLRVLDWDTDHFSLYALTVESGTSMEKQVLRGRLQSPDDDLAADQYELARELLEQAGYLHYEISSWARAGHESRHNRQYWLNEPYLGFGPGAHGYAAGQRYWTVRPIPRYLGLVEQQDVGPFPFSAALDGSETISPALERSETAYLRLRLLNEGLSRVDFEARFRESIDVLWGSVLKHYTALGWLIDEGERIRLAPRAYFVSNRLFAELLPDDEEQQGSV